MRSSAPFTVTLDAPARTVQLSGELDFTAAQVLDDIAMGRAVIAAVDLSAVTFLDTTVVNFVARVNARLTVTGDRLILVGVAPRFRKIFAIAGLVDLLREPT